MKMQKIEEVWNNDAVSPWSPLVTSESLEAKILFCERTGASRVVKIRWKYINTEISCPYPASILPDLTGVVVWDEWHVHDPPGGERRPWPRHLRVLGADGIERFRIYPPEIDDHSISSDSWIELPSDFSWKGISFGVPASDGYRDVVLEVDWITGEIVRWIDASNWLRR